MFSFTKKYPLPDFGLFGRNKKLKKITLQQISACNNRCIMCGLHRTANDDIMTYESLDQIFRSFPDFSGTVSISGNGEQYILDDLPQRLAYIKRHWPKCRLLLVTTFNIDKGKEFIANLFVSGLDEMNISCYGHDAEDYAFIHGNDAFSVVVKNITHLKSIPSSTGKVRLGTFKNIEESFPFRNTRRKQTEFFHFARANGIDLAYAANIVPMNNRLAFNTQNSFSTAPCSAVWGARAGYLHIYGNLDIAPCSFLTSREMILGNLYTSTPEEIFSSDIFIKLYHQLWTRDYSNLPLCAVCQDTLDSSEEEAARLAAWQGQRLSGSRVWFWGGGEAYRAYNHCFFGTKPQALFLDNCADMPSEIDGIPVKLPSMLALQEEKLPLIVFARPAHNGRILDTIQASYLNHVSEVVLAPERKRLDWTTRYFRMEDLE
jgi:MoaA/NifB/PqqE/SkfB family radical SAM enzyme